MSGHREDWGTAAGTRGLRNATHYRLAFDRFQELVARRHTRGAARCKHDTGDFQARTAADTRAGALPRCTAVISATMESAISAAPCAPMSSPIGAWMRAMSASTIPACRNLSTLAAC